MTDIHVKSQLWHKTNIYFYQYITDSISSLSISNHNKAIEIGVIFIYLKIYASLFQNINYL
jgi:hypothetical protein